jgi:hypothetical protein
MVGGFWMRCNRLHARTNPNPPKQQPRTRPPSPAQARQATAPVDEKADPACRTRDWAAIATNRDNLISFEEMEAYLAANPGPLRTASTK